MTRHMHSCGHVHECAAPDPAADPAADPLMDRANAAAVAALITRGWSQDEARQTVLGWYDDEDRLGYDEGHKCCPDCGDDPNDHTLHRDGCPRIDTRQQFKHSWQTQ